MAALDSVTHDEKKKLEQLIESGTKTLQEIDDLKGGLKDAVKAVAEELNVKPGEIMKAITISYKNTLADEEEKMETVKTILAVTGRA